MLIHMHEPQSSGVCIITYFDPDVVHFSWAPYESLEVLVFLKPLNKKDFFYNGLIMVKQTWMIHIKIELKRMLFPLALWLSILNQFLNAKRLTQNTYYIPNALDTNQPFKKKNISVCASRVFFLGDEVLQQNFGYKLVTLSETICLHCK